jgi:hypothetical protein
MRSSGLILIEVTKAQREILEKLAIQGSDIASL